MYNAVLGRRIMWTYTHVHTRFSRIRKCKFSHIKERLRQNPLQTNFQCKWQWFEECVFSELHRNKRMSTHTNVNAYAIGCGVLATIEQWYPTRKFNGTMVPHERNSIVWPHLVTIEKTIKYPTSAMCTYVCVYVCVCVCVCGGGGGVTGFTTQRIPY